MANIPQRLAEIIDDFQMSVGQEKLDLLLDFAERLPPLPERFKKAHQEMQQVEECMTPVFIQADVNQGHMRFYFDIPPESPTVRGYAALLEEGLRDLTPEAVLQVPDDFYLKLGLQQVLTPQRMHGISAMLSYMKHLALQHTA